LAQVDPAELLKPYWPPRQHESQYAQESWAVMLALNGLQITAPAELWYKASPAFKMITDFRIHASVEDLTKFSMLTHSHKVFNLRFTFIEAVRRHFGLDSLPDEAPLWREQR